MCRGGWRMNVMRPLKTRPGGCIHLVCNDLRTVLIVSLRKRERSASIVAVWSTVVCVGSHEASTATSCLWSQDTTPMIRPRQVKNLRRAAAAVHNAQQHSILAANLEQIDLPQATGMQKQAHKDSNLLPIKKILAHRNVEFARTSSRQKARLHVHLAACEGPCSICPPRASRSNPPPFAVP